MTKISTSNKIVEGVKPAIKAYLDKAELNKSAQQVAGKLRGHQARLTLNIHRQVFIGTSTITDAGSTVSNGDGLDTFLSQPKLVKGVKAEDRLDVITSYAREVMNAVYLEWEGQALKEENQLVRVAEVKNIHRQRLMFNQIAWILARGADSQKALIRKELKARDQKATLKRLVELCLTLEDAICLQSTVGGTYSHDGQQIEFSIQTIKDDRKFIETSHKKFLEDTDFNASRETSCMNVIRQRFRDLMTDNMIEDRTGKEAGKTQEIKNDMTPAQMTDSINANRALLEEVKVG